MGMGESRPSGSLFTSSAWKVPLWVPIVLVDGGIDSLARLYIGDAVIFRDKVRPVAVLCSRRENGWLPWWLRDRWQTAERKNADE